jgi:hypothetical protein
LNEPVKIKEASYSVGRLSAKKQFAVARRLGPFLGDIMPNVHKLLHGKGDMLDRAVELVPQITGTLAAMKDEDCDFIIDHCLAVTKMQQKNGEWASITTPTGVIMFPDEIDMMVMLQLTAEVVKFNLLPFLPTALLEAFAADPETSLSQP